MRARIYKQIGQGLYVGTSVFIGGFFYTCFVILGILGICALVYALWP